MHIIINNLPINRPQIKNRLTPSMIQLKIISPIQNTIQLPNNNVTTLLINLNRNSLVIMHNNINNILTSQLTLKISPNKLVLRNHINNAISLIHIIINVLDKLPLLVQMLSRNNHNLKNLLTQMFNIPFNIINQPILIQIKRNKINSLPIPLNNMINKNSSILTFNFQINISQNIFIPKFVSSRNNNPLSFTNFLLDNLWSIRIIFNRNFILIKTPLRQIQTNAIISLNDISPNILLQNNLPRNPKTSQPSPSLRQKTQTLIYINNNIPSQNSTHQILPISLADQTIILINQTLSLDNLFTSQNRNAPSSLRQFKQQTTFLSNTNFLQPLNRTTNNSSILNSLNIKISLNNNLRNIPIRSPLK